jgi:sulfofructose kinase
MTGTVGRPPGSAAPRPRVVAIGIATLDAIVAVDHLPGSDERVPATDGRLAGGGVAATAAVALARLGVEVALIGRVGDDEVGRWIRDGLAGEGVDVAGLRLETGRSPLSAVLVEGGSGSRALAPYPGDRRPLEATETDLERCRAAAWVHVDHAGMALVPALQAARIATPVSFDGGVPVSGLALDGVTLYAPTEAALLVRHPGGSLDEAIDAALDEGPSVVVVTRGARGALAAERGAEGTVQRHVAPGFAIDGVSTLGAGDVFHGALVAALAEQRPLAEALRFANAVAALSTRALDARSAIPRRDEVDRWLATNPDHTKRARADV